jgi:hypothetical protein
MVEIWVIAEKAVSEIRGRRTMKESTRKTKKMLLIGSYDFPDTPVMYLEPGKAPSLLMAKTTRVVTVM